MNILLIFLCSKKVFINVDLCRLPYQYVIIYKILFKNRSIFYQCSHSCQSKKQVPLNTTEKYEEHVISPHSIIFIVVFFLVALLNPWSSIKEWWKAFPNCLHLAELLRAGWLLLTRGCFLLSRSAERATPGMVVRDWEMIFGMKN